MSAPRVDPSTWSPRDRARHAAARGMTLLAWYLLAAAAIEVVGALVDALAEPADPPAWLVTLGLVARALSALGLLAVTRALAPWARALGVGAWIVGASLLAVLAAIVALARLAGVAPPEALPPDVWDPLTRFLAGALHAGALVTVLLVIARTARREGLDATARALAWSSLSLAAALLACLVVLEPAFLPSWWVGSGAPLLALVVLALVGVVPWDRALWPVLFVGLTGALLLVMQVSPVILAGLAAALGVTVAAVMPRGPLFDLATVVGEEPAAAPSRTFIRRLLDGPTDSQIGDAGALGSRVGSKADALDEAASLALAYRELGIEPPSPPRTGEAPRPAVAPAELPPLAPMARLEPKPTDRHGRPIAAEPPIASTPSPSASGAPADIASWGRVHEALQQALHGFIARTCTLVFGLVLIRAPIAAEPLARAIALLVLAGSTAFMALGVAGVARHAPAPSLRSHARSTAWLLALATALDVAVGLALVVDPAIAVPLLIADGATFVLGLAGLLILMRALFAHLGQPNARGRITALGFELLIFTALFAITLVASQSDDSDLAWLAYPTGIGGALAGLAFFGSFLWLVTDARSLIVDWQTRMRRSSAPDAREPGDPDPSASS
ncbi:MAG: hypothetical protein IT385_25850 [Deltaproteobacteria bacterium]|nr:hypothetical protein [Deltaproteobacteria bacterium]